MGDLHHSAGFNRACYCDCVHCRNEETSRTYFTEFGSRKIFTFCRYFWVCMNDILQLQTETVDRICASQVIADMNACVRELVENSLDSGAASVSIRIRKDGSEVEVCDNGSGISKHDWGSVCLPHSTSKLSNDASLVSEIIRTHGFRGEALASICVLSSGLKMTTRTVGMDSGHILDFGSDGRLTPDPVTPISRSIGTTVTVTDLFKHSLPVRFREAQKRYKKDVRVLSHMITELAIVNYMKQFELIVDSKPLVASMGQCNSEFEAYKKLVNGPDMVEFSFCLETIPGFRIAGWISRPVPTPWSLSSDSKGVFQYTYMHNRPINISKKLVRLLNGIYAKFEIRRVSFIIKFLPSENNHFFDVNTAVDKRDVVWSAEVEERILEAFEINIKLLFDKKEERENRISTPIVTKAPSAPWAPPPSVMVKRVYVNSDYVEPVRAISDEIVEAPVEDADTPPQSVNKRFRTSENPNTEHVNKVLEESIAEEESIDFQPIPKEIDVPPPMNFGKEFFAQMDIVGQFNNGFIIAKLPPAEGRSTRGELFLIDQHAANEKFLFEQYNDNLRVNAQILIIPIKLRLKPWIEEVVLEHAKELQRNGFNILYSETAPPGERITLKSLPTLSGIGFNRSAALTSQDFLEVVHRLDDELSFKGSRDDPTWLLKSLPSVRSSFASKACRTAVMVGDSLDSRKMKDIVTSLATLQQPWNCPHGRPTMKHLLSIDDLDRFS